jgi:glutathione S-transferase
MVQIGLAAQSHYIDWLAQTLDAGAADHFDYVTVHRCEILGLIEQGWQAEPVSIVPTLRKMLADKNPPKKDVPIWFTEIGEPVSGPITAGPHSGVARCRSIGPDLHASADGIVLERLYPEKERTMLTVFGNPMSTCTRKVLMTLAETKLPYEFVTVDMAKGEHKREPHSSRQPFGQVPAVDDGGFAFYESRAICRYLNEKAGGNLVPTDIEGRALMEQWISIETSNFSGHAMKFIFQDVFKRPQEPPVLETARQGLEKALAVMNTRLGKSPYFAGDQFTLADIVFMPYFEFGMSTPIRQMIGQVPHVGAWWNRVRERGTWQQVLGQQ